MPCNARPEQHGIYRMNKNYRTDSIEKFYFNYNNIFSALGSDLLGVY